jgi:hypothetical protein
VEYTSHYFIDPVNVQCIANGSYQWGFSNYVAIFFCMIQIFWIIGTYGVWVHMNRKGEMVGKAREMGVYRAAMDLAAAIGSEVGGDACAYGESEIRSVLGGRRVRYVVSEGKGEAVGHLGLSHDGEDTGKLRLRFGELYGREWSSERDKM